MHSRRDKMVASESQHQARAESEVFDSKFRPKWSRQQKRWISASFYVSSFLTSALRSCCIMPDDGEEIAIFRALRMEIQTPGGRSTTKFHQHHRVYFSEISGFEDIYGGDLYSVNLKNERMSNFSSLPFHDPTLNCLSYETFVVRPHNQTTTFSWIDSWHLRSV